MSEHSGIRFKKKEGISILLGKKEVGKTSYHHNSLWMARWTSQTQNEQGPILSSENTKTSVAEQLVIGMNHRTTTSSNLLSMSKNENFDFYFNTLTQKSVVSSNTEACEVLDGSDHFPMYSFKKKIESILNPKGKSRFENRISGLNLTFHSSEEFHFETQEQDLKNHQLTALESCSCSEEGNVSSSSQVKCPSKTNKTQSMDSADSLRRPSKRKAVSLFEMVSLPTEPYDMAQGRRKSKSCEDCKWHGMMNNYRNPEGRFEQTDALLMHKSISIEELASSRAQKVMTGLKSTRANSMATTSPGKSLMRDRHIGPLNTNQDPGPSWTVTVDAAESLPTSGSKRTADLNLMEMQEKPSGQEEYANRWLKRLRHDISSNPLMLNPKRLKVQNNDPSWVSEQKMKSWIQRWRVKMVPTEEDETPEVVQAELQERQFPSIHAMAMMGKAMNKIRPCEFQRRGPSLVWNNNEFDL